MTRRGDDFPWFVLAWAICVCTLISCSAMWGGGPENSWKVPVGKAAEVLRGAADTIERFDTSGDGVLDELEWTAAALAIAAELQRRGSDV